MDKFVLRRTQPSNADNAGTSRPIPSVSREINLDELPYDPADRKRITQYINNPRKQDEIRRIYLTRGPYRPQHGFKYPHKLIANAPRRFNLEWFKEYGGWLEYSEKMDKAFCLCCYLFRNCIERQAGNYAFVVDGFSGWNKKCRLDTHVGNVNSFHNVAVKRCDALMNQDQSIQVVLSKQSDITKMQNRIRLNASIDSVRYLLHQGLAFRGNDESRESKNKGNFRELVHTLPNQNDDIKKVVLRNAPENCQWIYPDIQKEIVSYFAKITLNSILGDIGGDVFSLLIDEASDVSDKEQMAVVLRYVDKNGLILERLIGVVHVKETSAGYLKSALQKLCVDIGLSLKQVRGQCYDGASNMRGEFNGLKAKILEDNKSAYYVHCFAHQLQLVIVAVAKKNEDVTDFFYMISLLFNVVGASCKRKDMIRENTRENIRKAIDSGRISTGTGLHQDQSLQRAEDTRWSSHYRTLSSLVKLFPSILDVLKYVEKEGKDGKKSQARGLISYFGTFDFVFYLHMMFHILGSAYTLSHSLQRKDQDILNAMSYVKSTRNDLQQLRDNGWETLLDKVYSFCEEHDISQLNMQDDYVNRHNPRKKTNITNLRHYQTECLNSVIDWQLQELDERFNEVNSALLTHVASFNPKDLFADFNLESLVKLAKFYPDDFDSAQLMDLSHELRIYIDNVRADQRFSCLNGIADLAKILVATKKHLSFPLVYRLLKLVLILPVATASVERCFSAMNIVKNVLRNKMGEEYMSNCLICYVEKDMFCDISNDAVIDLFKKIKNREGKL